MMIGNIMAVSNCIERGICGLSILRRGRATEVRGAIVQFDGMGGDDVPLRSGRRRPFIAPSSAAAFRSHADSSRSLKRTLAVLREGRANYFLVVSLE
jgi:hypothetical protein